MFVNPKRKYLLSILFVIISVLIGLSFFFYYKNYKTPVTNQLKINERDISFGSDSAQLTIFLFFRYDCIFCRKFFIDAFPLLKSDFIDQGKVKLVLKLVNLTNDEYVQISFKTLICLYQNGDFNPLHQLLLAEPQVVYTQVFDNMIQELVSKDSFFAECMLTEWSDKYLLENKLEFNRNGLTGTPTFLINNHVYKGFKEYNYFKKVIEKELNTVLR